MTSDILHPIEGPLQHPATLTARDWFLFEDWQDEVAAFELSAAALAAMQASSREAADAIAYAALDKWVEVGACDTEPRNVMVGYIEAVFGVRPMEPLTAQEEAEVEAILDLFNARALADKGGLH